MNVNRLFLILFLATISFAEATLGGTVDSKMKALKFTQDKQKRFTAYQRQERSAQVKEFAGKNGKIFAVTWLGKNFPEMPELLGEHYQTYRAALEKARKTHRG